MGYNPIVAGRFYGLGNQGAALFLAAALLGLGIVAARLLDTGRTIAARVLVAGFALRVAGGPRYSPFGRLSVHVLAPMVSAGPKMVAGAPKRFAQAIGLVMSAVALGLFVAGFATAGTVVLYVLVLAALAEAALGFCLGCWIYGRLQRAGMVSESACVDCADIWARPGMNSGN